jgi:hypothetical protein
MAAMMAVVIAVLVALTREQTMGEEDGVALEVFLAVLRTRTHLLQTPAPAATVAVQEEATVALAATEYAAIL